METTSPRDAIRVVKNEHFYEEQPSVNGDRSFLELSGTKR